MARAPGSRHSYAQAFQRLLITAMSFCRVATFLSCALMLAALPVQSRAQATPAPIVAREYRVLLVGNSLTYTNNLPALLRAVGASQGTPIITETYAAPGGILAERIKDGHVLAALNDRKFDVVVLQEQAGKLAACMAMALDQRTAPCAASLRAYVQATELASAKGARTLIFATWGPDDRWHGRLQRSAKMISQQSSADVFNAAGALQALKKASPGTNLFPDGTHPSTQASLMLALALYREVTGIAPIARDLRVAAPLLPINAAVSPDSAMETQSGLSGDGKVTVIPATLIEPLIQALPAPGSPDPTEMSPSSRRH